MNQSERTTILPAGGRRRVAEAFIDEVEEGLAGEVAAEVGADEAGGVVGAAPGLSADVGGDDDARETPEGAFRGKRLDFGDVETGAGEVAGLEGGDEVGFFDHFAAGDVDQDGAPFHPGK